MYDIDQTQVGQEHESELEKCKQVECDITIHGGATVTRCQYKQNAEPERQSIECGVLGARSLSQGQVLMSFKCKKRQLTMSECQDARMQEERSTETRSYMR